MPTKPNIQQLGNIVQYIKRQQTTEVDLFDLVSSGNNNTRKNGDDQILPRKSQGYILFNKYSKIFSFNINLSFGGNFIFQRGFFKRNGNRDYINKYDSKYIMFGDVFDKEIKDFKDSMIHNAEQQEGAEQLLQQIEEMRDDEIFEEWRNYFAALPEEQRTKIIRDKSLNKHYLLCEVLTAVSENDNISSLNLAGFYFNKSNARLLAKTLKENHNIKTLDLSRCLYSGHLNNSRTGLGIILNSLHGNNTNIETLKISYTRLNGSSFEKLCKVIESNQTIKTLELHSCGLTQKRAKRLVQALNKNNHIATLDLSENELSPEIMEELGKLNSPSLKEIRFQKCGLDSNTAHSLVEALNKNPNITTLDLSGNELTSSILYELQKLEHVTHLVLNDTKMVLQNDRTQRAERFLATRNSISAIQGKGIYITHLPSDIHDTPLSIIVNKKNQEIQEEHAGEAGYEFLPEFQQEAAIA